MKWNVILRDYETGKFKPYNIFEHEAFRLAIEKLFERQYPKDRFLKELDQEARYYFWAQIEWEFFITTWPPYINADEISRIISEYHINRPPEQALPEHIAVPSFFAFIWLFSNPSRGLRLNGDLHPREILGNF